MSVPGDRSPSFFSAWLYLPPRVSTDFQVGHPSIVVNNAGVVNGKLILDLKEEDVKK